MKKKLFTSIIIASMAMSFMACGPETNDSSLELTEEASKETDAQKASEKLDDLNQVKEDAVIEITNNYVNTPEFEEAFENDVRIGGPYRATGSAEVSEYSDWQEAYKALIEDLRTQSDNVKFALVYINDDDIPEMVYIPSEDNMIIATFDGSFINLFSSQISKMSYIEKANNLYATERVGAYYDDNVVAIKDGVWVQVAYGVRGPLDEWAEDSFDENGEPIISYWSLNDVELNSQQAYDDEFVKYHDSSYAKEISDFVSAEEILESIN